jgi:putative transposase
MSRRLRLAIPDLPHHVYQRAVDGQACFHDELDRRTYLGYCNDASRRHNCLVHAYVLMTNHVHFLMTPQSEGSMPRMMKLLSARYAQYFNAKNERTGPLWDGRYHSVPIDTEAYFFACQRYVELNPVRANIVDEPGSYRWSSYPANAGLAADPLVSPHTLYFELGNSLSERYRAYRALFDDVLPIDPSQIFAATLEGQPIGNKDFRDTLERLLGIRLPRTKKGGLQMGSDP